MNIPYGRQSIGKNDVAEVVKALKSDRITQGPRVDEFEKALAEYCEAKYAVAVSSGTAALHLAYLAAGLGQGDEVITTPNTFVATANMLLAVGAKPVFCDIRLDTYNIDETKIEKLITKRTKAIVPVHFAGQPCEMDKILKIAKKYKLLIIEDACHALGAKYKNKKIGSLGDISVFSFHPVKSITAGEGGAILTNNKNYYEKILSLRSHGIHKDKQGFNVMTDLGYNYRLTDVQSALGLSQMKKIGNFIKQRHKITAWYQKELAEIDNIILPTELADSYSAWHIYVIKCRRQEIRDKLAVHLKKNGVGINFHYPAVYAHPYYRKNGYAGVSLPNMDDYALTCLTLPLFPNLSPASLKKIVRAIWSFFR